MTQPLLQLNKVIKNFGAHHVFGPLSLTVNKGDRILISGENGAGKTTLFRCLSLLEPISDGEIIVSDRVINNQTSKSDIEQLMKEHVVGFVFQELHPWPHMTVLENLTKPLIIIKRKTAEQAKMNAIKFLKLVGLEDKKDQYPSFLSGGQKRRLIIARTLIMDPKILLLDEITANLDYKLKSEIFDIIKKVASDKTILIISHDVKLLDGFINKSYTLKGNLILNNQKYER